MKNISIFQAILIGVFGLGGVIGLFVFSTYSSKKTTAETIGTVAIWGVLPKEGVQLAIDTLAQTNQELKDVSYTQHDETNLKADLATAIATGKGPDLVLISQEDLVPLVSLLEPITADTLPPRTVANTFVQEAQLFETAQGIYGVPFLIDPLVLFYNRSILSSAGIAQPPSTWEALTGLVPKITKLTTAGHVSKALIALGTYGNVRNARGILSALFLQTGVPLSIQTGLAPRVAVLGTQANDNDQGTPVGQAVVRFYTQFADPLKVSYTWDASLQTSLQTFLAGDLALYLGYGSEASYIQSANPNLNFDITFFPQPQTAAAKRTYGRMYAFAIPLGSKNASGGYQAAATLTGATEQHIASFATGLAPASLSLLSSSSGNPILDVSYASALYATGWLSPSPADTDRVFSSMIQSVTSGSVTIDAALGTAERSLTALFQ